MFCALSFFSVLILDYFCQEGYKTRYIPLGRDISYTYSASKGHHQRRPPAAYSPVKDELNEDLLCGNRIVVTKSMQAETLLHQGHQDM